MSQALWNAVDNYFSDLLLPHDPVLDAVLQACNAASLPAINVAANQGRLLQFLAKLQGARKILEIGTLGGYSAIWLARALPKGGRLVTLERDPKHAAVARANFERAGLSSIIDLRLGKALDLLPQIATEHDGPFDMVFIDADKPSNPDYFSWALKLTRPGGSIVIDNVVRGGAVVDAASHDANVLGVRHLHEMIANERSVSATTIQTVGSKGYDGMTIVLVTSENT